MAESLPAPSPEAVLIRRAREAQIPRMSIRAAAAKVGLSVEGWGAVERGYHSEGKNRPPRKAEPTRLTIAQMAYAVDVTPEELEDVGRPDAAESLRDIIRRAAMRQQRAPAGSPRPRMAEIAAYFRDESIPEEERRRVADKFLALLPYFIRGEEPPPELLRDTGDPDQRSA